MKKLDRKQMAARVARDIPEGAYVNLGIGLPTLVGDYLPKGREIILHSENGILGAFQVSMAGDLANWHTGGADDIPAVGGAMDLAVGAKKVLVMMEHLTKDGKSKLVERCTYPLTGARCVDRIYTDLAVIDVKADGLHVVESVEGLSFEELQRLTGVPLKKPLIAA